MRRWAIDLQSPGHCYGNQARAYAEVRRAERDGLLVSAREHPCVDCGRPATEWDHYLGYAPENWLAVEARCKPCHSKRHVKESRQNAREIASLLERVEVYADERNTTIEGAIRDLVARGLERVAVSA